MTAACLDLGVSRVPAPGYVLSLDEPLYATVQSPPARQAPEGAAVVAALRYGARSTGTRTARSWSHSWPRPGWTGQDVVVPPVPGPHGGVRRPPLGVGSGGLAGRPGIEDTGVHGVTMAGDSTMVPSDSWPTPHWPAGMPPVGWPGAANRPDSSIVVA